MFKITETVYLATCDPHMNELRFEKNVFLSCKIRLSRARKFVTHRRYDPAASAFRIVSFTGKAKEVVGSIVHTPEPNQSHTFKNRPPASAPDPLLFLM